MMRERAKSARLLASLMLMAVICPFLLLGPVVGRAAKGIIPAAFPAEAWTWTAIPMSTSSPPTPGQAAAAAAASPAGAAAAAVGEQAGLGVASKQARLHALALGKKTPMERSSGVLAGQMQLMAGPEPRSIWGFTPFLMFAGVVLSLLAKLLLAQPCAKISTDALRNAIRAQLEAQGEIRQDLERGDAAANVNVQPALKKGKATSPTKASQKGSKKEDKARKPAAKAGGGKGAEKGDSSSSSSGSGRWRVSLEIPERGDRGDSSGSSSDGGGPGERPRSLLSEYLGTAESPPEEKGKK